MEHADDVSKLWKLRDFERWIRELYYFIWVEKTTK